MNRCRVLGGNGPITLSVPLDGGRNQKAIFQDVRILNSEKWQANHWKTLISCYNKSPWFDHYRDELEQLYSKSFSFLVDWNITCFEWVNDKLATGINWSFSDRYQEKYTGNNLDDWRGRVRPSTVDEIFKDAKTYPQVFSDRFGFVPNLSILDYLFCVKVRA